MHDVYYYSLFNVINAEINHDNTQENRSWFIFLKFLILIVTTFCHVPQFSVILVF